MRPGFRIYLLGSVLLLAGLLAACGGDGEPLLTATAATDISTAVPTAVTSEPTPAATQAPATAAAFAADIRNFTHVDLEVAVGTTVTWTNRDSTTYTSTSGPPDNPTGLWDSPRLQTGRLVHIHLR